MRRPRDTMTQDPLKKVKPEILGISAYDLKPHSCRIKLNQNENPFEVPGFIKERVARLVQDRPWGRYPDFQPLELCAALARRTGWPAGGIAVGNGSNELLQNVLQLVLERGRKLLLVTPTFTLYRILAVSNGAEVVEVPFEDFSRFPEAPLLEAMRHFQPEALVFCSPNNPTGTLLEPRLLERVLELAPGLVVLDQAYYEFSDAGAAYGLDLLARFPGLVITRTFSKALAAAGLRLGYLLAHPELVAQVKKVKLPYNINFVTLAAAEALLEHPEVLEGAIRTLVQERRRLLAVMAEIPGVEAFPSQANFILFRVPEAAGLFERLRAGGILIRDFSSAAGLRGCLRVSVGLPEENAQFLRLLREGVR